MSMTKTLGVQTASQRKGVVVVVEWQCMVVVVGGDSVIQYITANREQGELW